MIPYNRMYKSYDPANREMLQDEYVLSEREKLLRRLAASERAIFRKLRRTRENITNFKNIRKPRFQAASEIQILGEGVSDSVSISRSLSDYQRAKFMCSEFSFEPLRPKMLYD